MEVFLLSLVLLSLGSLTSVIVHRLPQMEFDQTNINLFFPRSHCVKCKTPLLKKDLIPLISYFIQGGKCRACKENISIIYLVHELVHLCVGLAIFYFVGFSFITLLVYILFFNFYVLLICDLQKFYLPFFFNVSISIIGIASAYYGYVYLIDINNIVFDKSHVMLSLYGFISGFSILWIVNFFYKVLTKEDGIGGGDFILLGGIGTFVGPMGISYVILLGSLSTLVIRIVNLKKYQKELPLGSGLIIGFFIYIIINYFELLYFNLVL